MGSETQKKKILSFFEVRKSPFLKYMGFFWAGRGAYSFLYFEFGLKSDPGSCIMYYCSSWILTLIWVGGGGSFTPPPPVGFPLITQKWSKLWPWNLVALSKILLETFVSSLIPIPRPSLQILGKTQTGVFPISGFLVNSL